MATQSDARLTDHGTTGGRAPGVDPLELLRYRSNLLGADLRITNFGGGNTSSKFELPDPLTGEPRARDGGQGQRRRPAVDRHVRLRHPAISTSSSALIARYRGEAHEDEMVGLYPLCAFGENRVAASIDTPLHAFLPFPHVDHLHPDWAIALAASANGAAQARGVQHAVRPQDRLGAVAAARIRAGADAASARSRRNPGCDGIILGGHGLFTWGDDAARVLREQHPHDRPDGRVRRGARARGGNRRSSAAPR